MGGCMWNYFLAMYSNFLESFRHRVVKQSLRLAMKYSDT